MNSIKTGFAEEIAKAKAGLPRQLKCYTNHQTYDGSGHKGKIIYGHFSKWTGNQFKGQTGETLREAALIRWDGRTEIRVYIRVESVIYA